MSENYKGDKIPSIILGLAKESIAARLSLYNKLGGGLYTGTQSRRNTSFGRVRKDIVVGMSFYCKFNKIIVPNLGWDTTANGDPEAHQRTEGELYDEIFFDNPHAWIETSTT